MHKTCEAVFKCQVFPLGREMKLSTRFRRRRRRRYHRFWPVPNHRAKVTALPSRNGQIIFRSTEEAEPRTSDHAEHSPNVRFRMRNRRWLRIWRVLFICTCPMDAPAVQKHGSWTRVSSPANWIKNIYTYSCASMDWMQIRCCKNRMMHAFRCVWLVHLFFLFVHSENLKYNNAVLSINHLLSTCLNVFCIYPFR